MTYDINRQEEELRQEEISRVVQAHEREELLQKADDLFKKVVLALKDETIWIKTYEHDGIEVWKTEDDIKNYPSKNISDEDDGFAPMRSEAIMPASPKVVHELFSDNSRVSEFNDNCQELTDLEILNKTANETTKICWSATGMFGPLMARDFVSLVWHKSSPGGGYASLATSIDHPKLSHPRSGYVRCKIQIGVTFMEPVPGRPDLTRLIQVYQFGQLGGIANNPIVRFFAGYLAENAPITLMKKIHKAIVRGRSKSEEGTLSC